MNKILVLILILMPVMFQSRDEDRKSDDKLITIGDLKSKMDREEEVLIIDARAGSSYLGSSVRIKGAIHITLDDLEKKMDDLPKDREIVVYCT